MVAPWLPAITVNSFALCILAILLGNVLHRINPFMLEDLRLFILMLVTNMVMLLLDSGTWLLDGRASSIAHGLNVACTTANYMLNPLMSILYSSYCDVKMGLSSAKRYRLRRLYVLMMGVNVLLSLLSIQGGFFFRINATNHYERGTLLGLSFLFSSALILIACVRLVRHLRTTTREESPDQSALQLRQLRSLMIFALPPLTGILIQILYNGVTVIWLTTVLSLLIVFITNQNVEIATDSLTGLFNRRQTDFYLQSMIQAPVPQSLFALVLMDLDHFKGINDQYGHNAGDRALKIMSATLQAECGKDEFCSRYGGDEFVLVTHHIDSEHLEDLLQRINVRLEAACHMLRLPFTLSASAGFAQWVPAMQTLDVLLALADTRLYEQKSLMRRRSSDRSPVADRAPSNRI